MGDNVLLAAEILSEIKKTDREWQAFRKQWDGYTPSPETLHAYRVAEAEANQHLQSLTENIIQWLEADQDLLDETVHDHKGHEAAAINNSSREEQIIYILTGR